MAIKVQVVVRTVLYVMLGKVETHVMSPSRSMCGTIRQRDSSLCVGP